MDSVSNETYNYIVIKTIKECENDIKEFIRRLKERIEFGIVYEGEDIKNFIDKLAGEKLNDTT